MAVMVAAKHANFSGGTHGRLLATLADTACFFPLPLIPAGRTVTTANLEVRIENAKGRLAAQGSALLLVLAAAG